MTVETLGDAYQLGWRVRVRCALGPSHLSTAQLSLRARPGAGTRMRSSRESEKIYFVSGQSCVKRNLSSQSLGSATKSDSQNGRLRNNRGKRFSPIVWSKKARAGQSVPRSSSQRQLSVGSTEESIGSVSGQSNVHATSEQFRPDAFEAPSSTKY